MEKLMFRRIPTLKEGRNNPFEYPTPIRTRSLAQNRVVVVVVGVACALFLFFYVAFPLERPAPTEVTTTTLGTSKPTTWTHEPDQAFELDPSKPPDTIHRHDPLIEPQNSSALVSAQPEQQDKSESYSESDSTHQQKFQQTKQLPLIDATFIRADSGPHAGFWETLEHVLSLLPDEIHQRELLRPIEGTGKEKLRELGLRSRAYRELFEAWEELHLIIDGTGTYIREDIMSYIHNYHDTLTNPSHSFGQILRTYESFRYFISQLSKLLFPWTNPYFSDHLSLHTSFHHGGRGIVMTAGDNQAPYILASIPSFRHLGCTLPIEIFYLGDDDLSEDYRAKLEALDGVTTRDLSQMVSDEGWRLAGWAAKPFSILFSSFREVVLIDADALFFVDPEVLFDDDDYRRTGALFFKDRLIMPESKKRWLQAVLPKPVSRQVLQSRMWTGESGHMQESGVIVVDKWEHFVALLLVSRMNGPDRDGKSDQGIIGIYDMVYGDKETFWIGWELVGDTEYAFHDGDAGTMGAMSDPEEGEKNLDHSTIQSSDRPLHTICALQLLHLSPDHRPLWFNGGLYRNKFTATADQDQPIGPFDVFLKEPGRNLLPGGTAAWKLEEGNICCLSSPEVFHFTPQEKEILDMLIGFVRKVGR